MTLSRTLLAVVLAAGLPGCQSRRPSASLPIGSKGENAPALDTSALGTNRRATLRALRMPPQQVARSLGAHRQTATSRLTTRLPGSAPQDVQQQISVRVDGKGQFAAHKHTSPQYGHEVIWTGGLLYPRLRYNKFLRRPAEPGEPGRLLDRLAGLLPAYVGLLRRFVAIAPAGRASVLGREAVRVKLSLAPDPPPPRVERSPARMWRRTLLCNVLEGEALLDARTGAPLQVELTARWKFNAPGPGAVPASGIPQKVDPTLLGETDLRFSLRVSDLGRGAEIKPPPEAETTDSPRLTRPELERQMIGGELPIEDGWGPP
jgi:hypothetical protein